jgi:hypothetical protein
VSIEPPFNRSVELPAETAAAIRALIAEVDDNTAGDITWDLIDLLRPITGPPREEWMPDPAIEPPFNSRGPCPVARRRI